MTHFILSSNSRGNRGDLPEVLRAQVDSLEPEVFYEGRGHAHGYFVYIAEELEPFLAEHNQHPHRKPLRG